jgi:predicted GTPase
MGAAGRDFHDFNTRFREDETREVVAFTATQIPYIVGRTYPPELAGPLYPKGIPIHDESELTELIQKEKIEEVYFSYSDVHYQYVMSRASVVQAAGANFIVAQPQQSMLPSTKPVIAVCAVRTGCGKSQTSRAVAEVLQQRGLKVAVVRHPMPYGKLIEQRCQRFEKLEDLEKHKCTIEEMEEYEPHLMKGFLVFAGVDYGEILQAAQSEADVVLWDGGNNDLPFFKADLHIVVGDPHRAGHERSYYPGEVNARMADVFVINKEDSADPAEIARLEKSLGELNGKAAIVHADSLLTVDDPSALEGKRVLCVEDGPTLTHGEMSYGAAVVAAKRYGAAEIVDPRPWLGGTMKETFDKYPGIGPLLPAMGYSDEQIKDMAETIGRVECDVVLIGTPIDLTRLVTIDKPAQRVRYDLAVKGDVKLADIVGKFLDERVPAKG